MNVSFRTTIFDASSQIPEHVFHGEDLAKWLKEKLTGWEASVDVEDWGWAVEAQKGKLNYIFGIYEYETNDVNEQGPKWIIAIYNERDNSHWLRDLFNIARQRRTPKSYPRLCKF